MDPTEGSSRLYHLSLNPHPQLLLLLSTNAQAPSWPSRPSAPTPPPWMAPRSCSCLRACALAVSHPGGLSPELLPPSLVLLILQVSAQMPLMGKLPQMPFRAVPVTSFHIALYCSAYLVLHTSCLLPLLGCELDSGLAMGADLQLCAAQGPVLLQSIRGPDVSVR